MMKRLHQKPKPETSLSRVDGRPLCVRGLLLRSLVAGLFMCGPGLAWGDWQLVWSDEFDGLSIKAQNWTFDIGNGSGGWGNNELEYYTSRPENAFVTNGLLHLVARQESYGGQNYTSAKLKTSGLFSQTCGRFEFSAKLPRGQGYWPALWMMPQASVYGGWAASGEIDVMENKGSNATNVIGTIHFGGKYPNQAQSSGPSFHFPAGDSVTNFHLYALEWTSNAISWFVDNQRYETQTNWWSSSNSTNLAIRNPYPAPFDQPFYIIMNLAVGGNFGGNPDGTTVFPGEMVVDYVRVYAGSPPPPPPPVLKLRIPFNDLPGNSVAVSDTNGGGVDVAVQMMNGTGAPADYHGLTNSGVGSPATGSRALNFSASGGQPLNPGPLAVATSANLGFGMTTNFVVSMWFKQFAMMPTNSNIGPRLFILGNGTPADTGAANSIGVKFQTASQLYFQSGGTTLSANFDTYLPTNVWIFIAAVYDGANLSFYKGSETSAASFLASIPAAGVDFGLSGALLLGNRQDRARSFNGWIDDFRFYSGAGGLDFVDQVRQLALVPAGLDWQSGTNGNQLVWTNGWLQVATNLSGFWSDVTNAASPFRVAPTKPQQFYRLRFQ